MNRLTVVVAVLAGLALAAAGCSDGDSGGSGTPTSAPTTTTATPAVGQLLADGVGPYVVGGDLAKLKSSGVLANLNESTGCAGWATADATPPYAGAVSVVFYQGKVSWVEVKSPAVSTEGGATVGMQIPAVKALYPGAVELSDGSGAKALSVHAAGGRGLFFRTAAGAVTLIEAGMSETLEFRFTEGEGC